ncbi:MAG: tRNA-modifying protein YgfZ [Candidatus Makana argininalis]
MKKKLKFNNKFYYLFNKLPLTFISMEKWNILKISGIDRIKYIQKKVTCDLHLLKKNNFIFGSYCNEKGKTISFFYIFYYKQEIFILVESSIIKIIIKDLKKYSIFSKVLFKKNNKYLLFGIAGLNSKKIIKKIFNIKIKKQESLFINKESIILYFYKPYNKFLIITCYKTYFNILNNFKKIFKFNDSNQWLLLDIQSGYPIIDLNNVNKFIPQLLNIDKLQGISFTKGCYLGQEIIYSFKYIKNTNKYLFYFNCLLLNKPLSGQFIEIKIKKRWFKIGTVLSYCGTINNIITIQSLIKKNINLINIFKIQNNYFKFIDVNF